MKKHKHFFWKYWLPIFLILGIIFTASSQPYDKQDLRPALSERFDLHKLEPVFQNIQFHYAGSEVSVRRLGIEGFIEFFIRKGAHFGIFFLLGFLVYRLSRGYSVRQGKAVFYSLGFVAIFAAIDEFHQSLTPNRTPLLHDVLLDIVGGIFGIMLAILIYKQK